MKKLPEWVIIISLSAVFLQASLSDSESPGFFSAISRFVLIRDPHPHENIFRTSSSFISKNPVVSADEMPFSLLFLAMILISSAFPLAYPSFLPSFYSFSSLPSSRIIRSRSKIFIYSSDTSLSCLTVCTIRWIDIRSASCINVRIFYRSQFTHKGVFDLPQ